MSVTEIESSLSPQSSALSTLRAIAKPSLDALRRLWLPFVITQVCGALVVVAYFQSQAMRDVCEHLADWKKAGGLLAAGLVMGIAGGFFPELLKLLTGVDSKSARQRGRDMAFATLVIGVTGITTDLLYTGLARAFGEGGSWRVLLPKLAIDLGLYATLVTMPWVALMYTWREHRYKVRPTVKSLGKAWYVSRVATILLLCWAYWLPMATLMYLLPASLTFVFSAVANVAVSTILLAVAGRKTERAEQQHKASAPLETASV